MNKKFISYLWQIWHKRAYFEKYFIPFLMRLALVDADISHKQRFKFQEFPQNF